MGKSLKILHVGKYFSPFSGGLENYMLDAMVALERRGVRSSALVHQHVLSLKTLTESYTVDGQDFHIVRTGMWARLLFTPISPAFVWHLRRFIRHFKPDILHLHLPNPSAFWVLALPSARRIPWVIHWHSDVITSAQDWRMRFFYRLYRPFESALLKRADTIVATSLPYRDSSEPLKPWLSKCKVVPLGVDVDRFTKSERASGEVSISARLVENQTELEKSPQGAPPTTLHPLQVLAVGRLTYYKGFRYLAEAAAKVPGIHVHIVGQGDQAENLKKLAASLNLKERITFHGYLSNAELARLMTDCDCLCLPSIERTEAFGMVLLEAMYFGKATVISDVAGSGMGWIVDNDVTGIKVEPANADSLAAALERLAENRVESASMGRNGREKFNRQFEINHAIEELLKIYHRIAGANALKE